MRTIKFFKYIPEHLHIAFVKNKPKLWEYPILIIGLLLLYIVFAPMIVVLDIVEFITERLMRI